MAGILFVCTGNMYRSPLAAAFFQDRLLADGHADWLVDSAGTWTQPGLHLPVETITAAAKFGIKLEDHLTQVVSANLLSQFTLIIVMEKGHKEALDQEFPSFATRTWLISQLTDQMVYDVMDPMQSGQEINIIASDLYGMVERAFPAICKLIESDTTPFSTTQ